MIEACGGFVVLKSFGWFVVNVLLGAMLVWLLACGVAALVALPLLVLSLRRRWRPSVDIWNATFLVLGLGVLLALLLCE